jgi:hypothetical protein
MRIETHIGFLFTYAMNFIFRCSLILLVNSFYFGAFAQLRDSNLKDSTNHSKKVFLGVGVQYISNLTYAGRTDLSSVPIALPTLTLVSKSGLFLGTAGYLNLGSQNFSMDGLSISPGYVFSLGENKKFGGVISATQYFFKDNSPVILSSFNTTTDLQVSYAPSLAKFTFSTSYQFGKITNDLINSIDVSKELSITRNKNLSILPTISYMTGTQSFTETYFVQGSRQRKIITNPPANNNPIGGLFPGGNNQSPQESIINEPYTEEQQKEVKKYQPLSLTFSLPIAYKVDKLQFSFSPYFIKAFNTVDPNSTTSTPSNLFLFTTGLNYTF